MLARLLEIVESCNLNFLLGSGLSSPYLTTLGSIETLLTELEAADPPPSEKKLIRCSLFKAYFDGVMSNNCKLLANDTEARPVLDNYCDFIRTLGTILLMRKSTILGKEANLFTTNVDIFLERAIEEVALECNDGFGGRFEPRFALSNFRKSHFKKSLQYDNVSELPTLNLLKLHGSLTWRISSDGSIRFCSDLQHVKEIAAFMVTEKLLAKLDGASTIESLKKDCGGKEADKSVDDFLAIYDKLAIVNPTKAKFQQTILNQTCSAPR